MPNLYDPSVLKTLGNKSMMSFKKVNYYFSNIKI